jgi:hypothetical protein
MRSAIIAGAVALVMIIVVLTATRNGRSKLEFSVADIKGDALGMSLEQYEKKHPESHCELESPTCDLRPTTYAGVPFNKSASFTGGRLYDLTYFGAPEFYSGQLLKALEEKYGRPRCVTSGKTRECDWWNGIATVRFLGGPGGTSVRFVLEDLASVAAQKAEAKQAQDRKADQ